MLLDCCLTLELEETERKTFWNKDIAKENGEKVQFRSWCNWGHVILCSRICMAEISFSFLCGIRGYHEYRLKWAPVLNEILRANQEANNRHEFYAVAVMKRFPGTLVDSVVGHLPRELSRLFYC